MDFEDLAGLGEAHEHGAPFDTSISGKAGPKGRVRVSSDSSDSISRGSLTAYLQKINKYPRLNLQRELELGQQMIAGRRQVLKAIYMLPKGLNLLKDYYKNSLKKTGNQSDSDDAEGKDRRDESDFERILLTKKEKKEAEERAIKKINKNFLNISEKSLITSHEGKAKLLYELIIVQPPNDSALADMIDQIKLVFSEQNQSFQSAYESFQSAYEGYRTLDKAKNELFKANLRLVPLIARQLSCTGPHLFDHIQDGNIGLQKAVERYDFTRGYKLGSIARWYIIAEINERRTSHTSTFSLRPALRAQLYKLGQMESELHNHLDRPPTDQELCDAAKITINKLASLRSVPKVTSLDEPFSSENEITLGETIADRGSDSVEKIHSKRQRRKLRTAIQNLFLTRSFGKKEGDILMRYYGQGSYDTHTLKELAIIHGCSPQYIGNIKEGISEKIRRVIAVEDAPSTYLDAEEKQPPDENSGVRILERFIASMNNFPLEIKNGALTHVCNTLQQSQKGISLQNISVDALNDRLISVWRAAFRHLARGNKGDIDFQPPY